jgi:enamine deaminase RidA (YjgF/YER057c/UK114 family)
MARTKINPWTYPGSIDAGVLIENPNRILFVNGQCAVSEDGRPLYPGDIRSQALGAIDNIEVVLQEAGMSLTNIVRMNTYVTDRRCILLGGARVRDRTLRPLSSPRERGGRGGGGPGGRGDEGWWFVMVKIN